MSRLLSVTECARHHAVTRKTVQRAIQRGALAAERVGHIWVITEEACARYQPIRDPQVKGRRGAEARWGGAKVQTRL
jgi:excisionase family DNA binding protein